MADLVPMSEATALALHAMALIAKADGPLSAGAIAQAFQASEAHVAKVLQTLARAGFLISKRGPEGGYTLARPKSQIRLLDIYETFEGKVARIDVCLSSLFAGAPTAFSMDL
jgi:Rrf2 family protein